MRRRTVAEVLLQLQEVMEPCCLAPPVVVLSSWRMKSSSILWDIYLNKVPGSNFDKGVICKHPTHCAGDKAVTQTSKNGHWAVRVRN